MQPSALCEPVSRPSRLWHHGGMATTKRTRTSAKKWEYALAPVHPNLLGLLKGGEEEPPEDDPGLRPLNLMGEIGWEAVGFAPNPARPEEFFALLKRPRR
jgi:hypothetical protein